MAARYLAGMTRRGISSAAKGAAALQAARRMVARGERPGYRLRAEQDGSWMVEGLPRVTRLPQRQRKPP
jgi:hypothetical protein